MALKYTKLERNWVMYDVGNSALVLLNTSVVPIYFNAINTGAHPAELVTAWANAQTIASLVVALLMPILGSLADYAGNKIKFFTGFFLTGLVLCLAQAIPMSAAVFLVVYVLCTIGLNSSMTFYDAMLTDVTTDERMDSVSSSGYAWGYVGSTVPFILCIALIFGGPSILGLDTLTCTRLTFLITGAWWLAFTIPLLRTYKQRFGKEREGGAAGVLHNIALTLKGLLTTMRRIAHDRVLLVFMVAFFFYIDGVHTVISMATSYGAALGIDSTQLVLALLVTQFVAFPSAIIYGKLAGRVGTLQMIIVAVAAYVGIVLLPHGARRLRVARFTYVRCGSHTWMVGVAHLPQDHASACLALHRRGHGTRLRARHGRVWLHAVLCRQLRGHYADHPHCHLLRVDGRQHLRRLVLGGGRHCVQLPRGMGDQRLHRAPPGVSRWRHGARRPPLRFGGGSSSRSGARSLSSCGLRCSTRFRARRVGGNRR